MHDIYPWIPWNQCGGNSNKYKLYWQCDKLFTNATINQFGFIFFKDLNLCYSQVELVYQTQFFKGLANGGNVSAAFSLGELTQFSFLTVCNVSFLYLTVNWLSNIMYKEMQVSFRIVSETLLGNAYSLIFSK